MDLSEALQRIEELEQQLADMQKNGLPDEDKQYVKRLKADMRKAAAAREESEQKATQLQQSLDSLNVKHKLELRAQQAGCVDIDTFITAINGKGLPESDDAEQLDEWFKRIQSEVPYFFNSPTVTPEGAAATIPCAPLVAASRNTAGASTQQLAARNYKTQ